MMFRLLGCSAGVGFTGDVLLTCKQLPGVCITYQGQPSMPKCCRVLCLASSHLLLSTDGQHLLMITIPLWHCSDFKCLYSK